MTEQQSTLFREEVLEARRMHLEGEIYLSRPLHADAIVAILACSMIGLATWIATARYARTEIIRGVLVTDDETSKIVALHSGIVTRVDVVDGQAVRKGQTLVTVEVDQQYAEGSRATEESLVANEAQQQLGKGQVAAARIQGKSERVGLLATISSAHAQFANVEEQISIQKSLLKSLNAAFERYKPVAAKGFISQTQMDAREQQILSARQQFAQLNQQLITLKTSADEASAKFAASWAQESSQVYTARSSIEGLHAQRSQLRAQQSYVLSAPTNGVVTAVQTGVGRTVDASVPLMMIVPTDVIVHADLYAPSRAIGFVRPGNEVRLLYDAFPYQRFGSFEGRVRAVSRVALDPRQLDAPFKIDEPVYRIRVTPGAQRLNGHGEAIRLQPGMTLTANVVLERQTFLEWVLEPLNAVMKRDR